MVVFVVLHGMADRINAEAKRCFHFSDEFVIDCSLFVVVVVILILRLVKSVPWVLLQFVNTDTLGWVSHENLGYDIFCIFRQEFWQLVVCI